MVAQKRNTTKLIGAPDCKSARCGMDAGCRKEQDGSWICICTQDLNPPRADGTCPRIVVEQYPREDSSSQKNFSTYYRGNVSNWLDLDPYGDDKSVSTDGLSIWLLALTGIALIIVVVVAVVIFLWRQKKTMGPPSLFHHILHQDRYVFNEDYEGGRYGGHHESGKENAGHSKDDGMILLREWIQLEEEIGQGCFGQVYRGRYRRPGASSTDPPLCDETVAVKVLKTNNAIGREAERELFREARIMSEFSHPNILAVRGVVINEGKVGPWLVFEYMSLGDLAHLLRTSTGVVHHSFVGSNSIPSTIEFKEADLMSVAGQVASGMAYLSLQRFVHRDLACRNCLVNQIHKSSATNGSPGIFLVKISDFGMSRDVYTTDYYRMGGSQNLLPVRWMSPESILYGKFTSESDVWSYGVFLWEVFSKGAQPYYGHSNEEVVSLILDGILLIPSKSTPPFIREILHGCWKSQPVDRLTFQQIDDQLMAEERRVRSSSDRKKNNMDSYINPMELAPIIEATISAMKMSQEQEAAVAFSINSTAATTSADYFQLLPSSPNEPCSISHQSNVIAIPDEESVM